MISSAPLRTTSSCAALFTTLAFGVAGGEVKKAEPVRLAFVVTEVHDTDRIEARFRDRKVILRMANVVPFAKWPGELTQEQRKLKEDGLALLARRLKGEKVVISGIDLGPTVHGDLVLHHTGSFTQGAPSTLGWFIVHVNCLLIEEGYTVYQKDPPELFFPDADLGFKKQGRKALYEEAEAYAAKSKNGIWRHPGLANKLRALPKPAVLKK